MSDQSTSAYVSSACDAALVENGYAGLRDLFKDAFKTDAYAPQKVALELAQKFNGTAAVQERMAIQARHGDADAAEVAAWMARHGLKCATPEAPLSEVRELGEKFDAARTNCTEECQLLHAQLSQLQAIVETYYNDAENKRVQLAQLEDEHTRLRADRDNLISERDALSEERNMLVAEIDRIFKSKSWRVTEPLRSVRRAVDPSQRER